MKQRKAGADPEYNAFFSRTLLVESVGTLSPSRVSYLRNKLMSNKQFHTTMDSLITDGLGESTSPPSFASTSCV